VAIPSTFRGSHFGVFDERLMRRDESALRKMPLPLVLLICTPSAPGPRLPVPSMSEVNPDTLRGARETAGFELAEAAENIALGAAKGVDGAARLAALKVGDGEPTRPLVRS